MAILGVDYGERKVGLAKAAPGTPAVPLGVVALRSRSAIFAQIVATCIQEGITEIVVGLPVHMDAGKQGVDSPVAAQVRRFAYALQRATKLPVHLHDERLTTQEAQRLRQGLHGGPEDAVAAMLVLQSWVDKNRPATGGVL
ncbi:MAG: Holliday junction resolvase RuvX [Patescibacteria group bacterium]|nr:Holliday junction resolvase RuvX [Patescibacteria group bacterium]